MEDIHKYYNELEKDGYITSDGKPLKCLFCDSVKLVDTRVMQSNYGIEEYEVECCNCKKTTGRWAYGYWALL